MTTKTNCNSSHLKISMQIPQYDYCYRARQPKQSRGIYGISSFLSWSTSSSRNQGKERVLGRLYGIGYLIEQWLRKWTTSRTLRTIGSNGTMNCYRNFYGHV